MSFKKIVFAGTIIIALFLSFNTSSNAEAETTLAANEAVVTNFDELQKAISEDNGIDTIYLGADVELSAGIKVPVSKKSLTLSGKDPVTNEIHTLTETMSSSVLQSSVITIDSNSGTKETTLKDMKILGKNYYGTISVLSAAKDVVQNYENIDYQGPQLVYNLNGTTFFSGKNSVKIAQVVSGSASPNEVAETKSVNVSGELLIDHDTPNANSVFWFGLGTSDINTFTVEENANVKIISNGTGMFYRSGSKPIDMTVKANAKLDITSDNNIFRDLSGGAINIDAGADVTMTKTDGTNPLLWLSGSITVNPDARFVLKKTGGTDNIIHFTNSDAKLDIRNPRSFLMATEQDSAMLYWPYKNTFDFEAQMVNYWNTAGSVVREDLPAQYFNLPNGENVIGSLTFSGSTTNILTTNAGMTSTNFDQKAARMIAMGHLEGTINPVTDADNKITGNITKDAYIAVSYHEDGVEKKLTGQADSTGNFQLAIPNGFIKPYTELKATITQDQRNIVLDTITVEDVTRPNGEPVNQILNINDTFPEVSQLVTNIYDHSDNTSGAGISKTIISQPDTATFGPTTAIVRLEDKAGNYTDITVPVFIKDDATVLQDDKALRAKDFVVKLEEINSLSDEALLQLILSQSEAQAFNVNTGENLTSHIEVKETNLQKDTGAYTATLQIGTLTKDITIQVTGELKFNQIPTSFSFETISLQNQKNIAKRNDSFAMSVQDSRGSGSKFRVTAAINSPLTSTTNSDHTLPNGLIFVDGNGEKTTLSNEPVTVFTSNGAEELIVPVDWEENQGILVEADTSEAYADEAYETTIEWTLTDAP